MDHDRQQARAKPLAGRRFLVPPARPQSSPLGRMLERRGAEVLEFPAIRSVPPRPSADAEDSLSRLARFDWVVVSGSPSAEHLVRAADSAGLGHVLRAGRPRLAAIGSGAAAALRESGVEVGLAPSRHVPKDVVAALGPLVGKRVLLVRVAGASPALPLALAAAGAAVCAFDGYVMEVRAEPALVMRTFDRPLDALALVSPTAVRYLLDGAGAAGLDLLHRLAGVPVLAVGEATALRAAEHGLAPLDVADGHIARLARLLEQHFAPGRQNGR